MHWTPRRERLRTLICGDRCIYPASVFDPISARIAEDLGFESGMFAGSIASLTVLGAPDLIVLTLSEFAEQTCRINRAGDLPLIVDADHGYGNALNVKRTVEELEIAGVAALTIEDTDLPQPFGTVGQTRLLSISEGVGKMKAALAGRQDSSLIILGRTSVPLTSGIEDTIHRVRAYQDTGVDMLMLVGVKTRSDLEAIADAVSIPLMLGGAGAELMDLDYLSRTGVRIFLQGHKPFMAAVKATHETLKALRDGTPPAKINTAASGDFMKAVTREADYQNWMNEFLI